MTTKIADRNVEIKFTVSADSDGAPVELPLPISSWSWFNNRMGKFCNVTPHRVVMACLHVRIDGRAPDMFALRFDGVRQLQKQTTDLIRQLAEVYGRLDTADIMAKIENLPVTQSRIWVDSVLESQVFKQVKRWAPA